MATTKLQEYLIYQNQLDEKLIQYGIHSGGNPKYGNITILMGGAASGKNYVINNFLDATNYKIFDVDELKSLVMKLNQLKDKYPELNGFDLSNQNDVFDLHVFIRDKIKDKVLNQFFSGKIADRLPNLLFNTSGKTSGAINEYINLAVQTGYKPENINLTYILNDFEVQIEQNDKRDRRVPIHVLVSTTTGSAATFINMLRRPPKNLDGRIDCVVNLKSLTKQMKSISGGSFISDFEYVNLKKPGRPVDVNNTNDVNDRITSLVWDYFRVSN